VQGLPVELQDLVGAEHEASRIAPAHRERLFGGEACSKRRGVEPVMDGCFLERPLVDAGGFGFQRQARVAQEVEPGHAGRGQDERSLGSPHGTSHSAMNFKRWSR
jgi:hypothetical protein